VEFFGPLAHSSALLQITFAITARFVDTVGQ